MTLRLSTMLAVARRFPSSLFARMLFITIVSLVSYLLVFFIAFRTSVIFLSLPSVYGSAADPLAQVVRLIESASPDEEESLVTAFSSPTRAAQIRTGFPPGAEARLALERSLIANDPSPENILKGRRIRFRYMAGPLLRAELPPALLERFQPFAAFEISVELEDSRVLSALFSPASVITARPGVIGALLALSAVLIGGTAAVFIRQSLKPLSDLERATKRFGATIDMDPVAENGAEEIRRLARTLNRAQSQIQGLVAERSRMAGSLAHDVLTSLTRLRLRIERRGEIDRSAIGADIDQMEALIDDLVVYTRSGEPNAPKELIELVGFAARYVAETPGDLLLNAGGSEAPFTIAADPKALIRIMNNLVDNARTYGTRPSVRCERAGRAFLIHVEDEGPGVSEDKLDEVFEAFYRVEASRSRETGGSGLGLGIAKGLMIAQGGDLRLENRTPTGLRATLVFPLSIEVP